MTETTPPAVWVDGDPLMEAIASAVYERCETGDGGIVHDDPRNIAVAALAAVLPTLTDLAAEIRSRAFKTAALYVRGHSADERYGHSSISTAMCAVSDELRRMADGAQQPETQAEIECANCWREVENRSTPNMGGPSRDNWVHVPGGFTVCFPQRGADSPRAEPKPAAVSQPAVARQADTAGEQQ
jgi:hypothetical protein